MAAYRWSRFSYNCVLRYDMATLLDSHCHVNDLVYGSEQEVNEVITRAKLAGVQQMVTIGSGYGLKSMSAAVRVAERFQDVYASVGVHPQDAGSWTKNIQQKVSHLAKMFKVVALGEMGLDFYAKCASAELQRKAFREQIGIAKVCGLPIIIHDRYSNGEAL